MGNENLNAAYTFVHTLKGVAGNLGMETVFGLADDIDRCIKARNRQNAAALVPDLEGALEQVLDRYQGVGASRMKMKHRSQTRCLRGLPSGTPGLEAEINGG